MQNVQRRQAAYGDAQKMEKSINSSSLRSRLSPVLDDVQFNWDNYIIERNGRPAAAIVPINVYENWKQSRERFFEIVEEIQEANKDADPNEVMALVLEAQQAVRTEMGNEADSQSSE
jgi:prevent-host-death family protein